MTAVVMSISNVQKTRQIAARKTGEEHMIEPYLPR